MVVSVEDRVKHVRYGKVSRASSRPRRATCGVGDRVRHGDPAAVATKRWRVVEILEKAK